jgi:hypothetical protein
MDKDEFPALQGPEPRHVASWFGAEGQTTPHHWYGLTHEFDEPVLIGSLRFTNLCSTMTFHVTGIAGQ